MVHSNFRQDPYELLTQKLYKLKIKPILATSHIVKPRCLKNSNPPLQMAQQKVICFRLVIGFYYIVTP